MESAEEEKSEERRTEPLKLRVPVQRRHRAVAGDNFDFMPFENALYGILDRTGNEPIYPDLESSLNLAEGESPLFDHLVRWKLVESSTNFDAETIEAIASALNVAALTQRHKREFVQLSALDHVVLYLMWLKSAESIATLASMLHLHETIIVESLARVRVGIYNHLAHKWLKNRPRPVYDPTSAVPASGLVLGMHVAETSHAIAKTHSSRMFYDEKLKLFCLKTEIAVSPTKPHYCLFISPHAPAKVENEVIHQTMHDEYLSYLTMRPIEKARAGLVTPNTNYYWHLLCGPHYHITPTAGGEFEPLTLVRYIHKEGQESLETSAEQFLGRLLRLWGVFRKKWIWDRSHFDYDFAIACLLTNEHLQLALLDSSDSGFYRDQVEARAPSIKERIKIHHHP